MSKPDFKEEWKTTANLITITRIVFIPLFVIALLAPWPQWFLDPSVSSIQDLQYLDVAVKPWVAAAVYAVLALTDGIDGYIARSRNQVTALGKFLDPIADKVLVAAALLALVELGDLPSWVALVIITREFIVSGLRMIAATDGVVVAARMSGKVKTALTLVAVLMFIIKRSELVRSLPDDAYMAVFLLSWAVMIAAVVMTVVSMLQYFKEIGRIVSGEGEGEDAGVDADAGSSEMLAELAARVVDLARQKGVKLACAESLTGGMIGAVITSVPGSSDVFEGGVISYSYDVKERELGVSRVDLDSLGAVSEPVALQMAEGALGAIGEPAQAIAVAVTGVAGPGASEGKPAGTVWFGIAGCGDAAAHCEQFAGGRQQVREQTVAHALQMMQQRLETV